MKLCPKTNQPHSDLVFTPTTTAQAIINHFKPSGKILDPAAGNGAFADLMPGCDKCEISQGIDFFNYTASPDWIITNPPWSKIRQFVEHAIAIDTKNIVFLINFNALTTRSRLNTIYKNGYSIKEVACGTAPKEWPQTGFQLAAIHIAKGQYSTKFTFNVF